MVVDFSNTRLGMTFTNGNAEENFTVPVIDQHPELGDFHREGRRIVEMSVELFIALMQEKGFLPIDPATGLAAVPKTEGDTDGTN